MNSIFYGEELVEDLEFCGGPPVRVMSTFSGIGAASVSWQPDAFIVMDGKKHPKFEFVAYAEIEPFPCHVLHYRRGASRPKYLPDPQERGISQKDARERKRRVSDVSGLPTSGVTNFGDITQITDDDLHALGYIDILEGGSPCQAFSVAGDRQGLNDPRGNLLLAFCRLAERMRKINGLKCVVWENVHGVLSDKTNGFGCLLASLAGEQGEPLQPPGRRWTNAGRVSGPLGRRVAWRTIQASHWGIPQRRKRVFVVAHFRPHSNYGSPCDVLFELEGNRWHPNQVRKTRQVVVPTYRSGNRLEYRSAEERLRDPIIRARLDAEASTNWLKPSSEIGSIPYAIDMKSQPYASRTAYALTAKNEGNPPAVVYALADDFSPKASNRAAFTLMAGSRSGGGHKQMVIHPRTAGTLCASGAGTARSAGMASELDFVVITKAVAHQVPLQPSPSPMSDVSHTSQSDRVQESAADQSPAEEAADDFPQNWVVRRFTPLECERLQGFPDHWTDVPFKGKLVSDGHRYKAIGNSMACPVMSYIGNGLEWMMEIDDFYEANPILQNPNPRKRGRPPLNGLYAMTAAERQRARRERLRASKELH